MSMDVLDFEPSMIDDWDRFVEAHPLAGYGHLSGNFALADATPGVRNRSLVVKAGRSMTAILPLFEQSDHVLRAVPVRQLVSGPFFPAGPLVSAHANAKEEANVVTALAHAIRERSQAFGVDQVSVGYPTVTGGQPTIQRLGYSPFLHHGYKPRPGVALVLDLTRTPEQLGAGRKSSCRQTINKAQSAGLAVTPIASRDEWMACYPMNVRTLGSLALSPDQLAVMWDAFMARGHATAYAVRSTNGELAGMTAVIRCGATAYYWHGWRSDAQVPGASYLALWTAIMDAREQGCRTFELGSLDFENPKNIGISQFKQSFGGAPYQTLGAQLDLKPVKAAALGLAAAVVASLRQRRRPARVAAPAPAVTPAPAVARP